MSDPPVASIGDAKRLTLCEMADLHELLDLREEAARRVKSADGRRR